MTLILIADVQEAAQRLCNVLVGRHEVFVAQTFETAREFAQNQSVDEIICGLHFDDSRMLDFLTWAKKQQRTERVPFICLQYLPSKLIDKTTHSAYLIASLIGADLCLESHQMEGMTDEHLLEVIEKLMERHQV